MEVKERIINQIGEITGGALLEELELIINDLRKAQSFPYELDEAMMASVEKSDRDFEDGRFIDHQQAMKTMKEWLKER